MELTIWGVVDDGDDNNDDGDDNVDDGGDNGDNGVGAPIFFSPLVSLANLSQTTTCKQIRVTIVAILQNFKVINCCQILKDLKVKLMKTWR